MSISDRLDNLYQEIYAETNEFSSTLPQKNDGEFTNYLIINTMRLQRMMDYIATLRDIDNELPQDLECRYHITYSIAAIKSIYDVCNQLIDRLIYLNGCIDINSYPEDLLIHHCSYQVIIMLGYQSVMASIHQFIECYRPIPSDMILNIAFELLED